MVNSHSQSGKRRPDLSATDAVQLQIDSLLSAVVDHFNLATEGEPGEESELQPQADAQCHEAIHQLRICSRRSQATLSVYADILPKKPARWLRRRLKRIRQAAGICRDLDVLKERFTKLRRKRQGKRHRVGKEVRRLIGCLESERHQAGAPLRHLHAKLILSGKFSQHKTALLDELDSRLSQEPASCSLEHETRTRLQQFTRRFLKAGRLPLKRLPEIHQFRIRIKQLRYALEALADQLPQNSTVQINLALTNLQKVLGELNDLAFAKKQIKRLKKTARSKHRKYLKSQLMLTRQQLERSKVQLADLWDSKTRKELKCHLERLISSADNESNPPSVQE